jgi:hypothetical protein
LGAALKTCKIETIDLRCNRIGDGGSANLGAMVSACPELACLHVGWNGISPIGIEKFVRKCKLSQPRKYGLFLDFSGNKIDMKRKTGFSAKLSSFHQAPVAKTSFNAHRNGGELLAKFASKWSDPNVLSTLHVSLCGCGLSDQSMSTLKRASSRSSNVVVDLRLN